MTTITGTITDSAGVPYANGQIKAFSTTPNQYTTKTDASGVIQQPFILPAGTYTFVVSTPGVAVPLGTGQQQFTVSGVAISGTSQDISVTLNASAVNLLATFTGTLTAAAQPTFRKTDSELTLGYQGSTAISGSVAAVRGNTTISNGTNITAGYVYGTQGKLTVNGTISSSSEVSCGVLGQLDLSAATGLTGPIAAIWGDCGATMGTVTPGKVDIAVLYNTTTKLINSAIRVAADASYFADLTDLNYGGAHWLFPATTPSSLTGKIKVNINGTAMYIPLYAS